MMARDWPLAGSARTLLERLVTEGPIPCSEVSREIPTLERARLVKRSGDTWIATMRGREAWALVAPLIALLAQSLDIFRYVGFFEQPVQAFIG